MANSPLIIDSKTIKQFTNEIKSMRNEIKNIIKTVTAKPRSSKKKKSTKK